MEQRLRLVSTWFFFVAVGFQSLISGFFLLFTNFQLCMLCFLTQLMKKKQQSWAMAFVRRNTEQQVHSTRPSFPLKNKGQWKRAEINQLGRWQPIKALDPRPTQPTQTILFEFLRPQFHFGRRSLSVQPIRLFHVDY